MSNKTFFNGSGVCSSSNNSIVFINPFIKSKQCVTEYFINEKSYELINL